MTTTPVTATPADLDAVIAGRARLDQIDDALVDLIRERIAVSRDVQRARAAGGGPRIVTSREREVVQRWHTALGPTGGAIALNLLELSRGPW